MRGWESIFHANGKQKKARIAILILDKTDLNIKITRDKEGHSIMIKGSIQEEGITNVNIYEPNIGSQYIRQTLTDITGEIDNNTIIGNFNNLLTPMETSSKQKIHKETQVLNDNLDEMELIDNFMTFHENAGGYSFFSSAHRTFSRIEHILGNKSNLSKFKKTEIVSSIFSDHTTMRLDINYKKKKAVRNTKTQRVNNIFLNNQQVTEEIKREIKKLPQKNNNENMTTQNLWDAAKAVLIGKFIAIQSYLKKQEKLNR